MIATFIIQIQIIVIQMDNQSVIENDNENHDIKPLSIRLKNHIWTVRKRAYQQILSVIDSKSNLNEQFTINNEIFHVNKLISIINNLVEEKHPNVLLKGLQCAQHMLKNYTNAKRQFNKLVVQGLQKFPLVTQQRKAILQKFLEILQLYNIEPSILSNRLSLPHQKSVMYVIEVIGFLGINSLKPKLIEMVKKHPKKEVKQLAGEIAKQLQDQQQKQQIQVKQVKVKKEDHKPKFKIQLIQKLPHFDQLQPKKQQEYTQSLLEAIDQIANMHPHGTLSNFCYYVQLMIESNNQIISINGIKMLTALVKQNSPLISTSYPLLFFFRKFKMHKTHSTNIYLFNLIEAILCSSKSNDLMNAIYQGLGSMENKIILKYGCTISFIRVFSYYYKQEQLFEAYCIGEYQDLYPKIQNKKYVEKMIAKSFEIFCKEKDKQYVFAIQKMKEILGIIQGTTAIKQQKSSKDIINGSNNKSASKNLTSKNSIQTQSSKTIGTNPTSKPIVPKPKQLNSNLIISTQGELNKILQIAQTRNISTSVLAKAITKCLQSLKNSLKDSIYDLFYYCQILQSFIQSYKSRQQTDDIVSQFLISYLKLISQIQLSEIKKKSKITQTGLQYLLKLAICRLVLSKQLIFILDNIAKRFSFEMIMKCLGSLFVANVQVMRKKNKKYLIRWLQENTSEQFINNSYFELKEAIQSNTDKQISQKSNQNKRSPKIEKQQINNKQIKNEQLIIKKQVKQVQIRVNNIIESQFKYKDDIKNQSIELNSNSVKINFLEQKRVRKVNKKEEIENIEIDRLQLLQNADISKIQEVNQANSDRLDQRWEYFLNKKAHNQNNYKTDDPAVQQQKYNFSQQNIHEYHSNQSKQNSPQHYQHEEQPINYDFMKNKTLQKQKIFKNDNKIQNIEKSEQKQINIKGEGQSEQEEDYNQEVQEQKSKQQIDQLKEKDNQKQQNVEQEFFQYKYLNYEKIQYMINNSNNPFNHLRTSILLPFKSATNKAAFLRELTHLIQNQTLKKPQPFNSILLVIILLFTQIKIDRSIIQNLQYLYEFMAQRCTNNQFLKTIISLYHCVIDQTQQDERKLLLTILTKSMLRIMPHVQNALQLLKDFQQFYQIGEMFDMFSQEYDQIKKDIESSQNLQFVIRKAYEEQGQNLYPIVQGWLETKFKQCIKQYLTSVDDDEQPN